MVDILVENGKRSGFDWYEGHAGAEGRIEGDCYHSAGGFPPGGYVRLQGGSGAGGVGAQNGS